MEKKTEPKTKPVTLEEKYEELDPILLPLKIKYAEEMREYERIRDEEWLLRLRGGK